jgi:uncharacterized membrane protein AbrB (regulator of aidB expression)
VRFACGGDDSRGAASYGRDINDLEVQTMFFPTLIGAPILAGLVAGVWTARRAVPWGLAALCVALGGAGAIAAAFNSDHRLDNVTFGIGAGVVCAGLVWVGYALGRVSRRSARPA